VLHAEKVAPREGWASYFSSSFVHELKKEGALDQPLFGNESALGLACQKRSLECVERLLDAEAFVDTLGSGSFTPLMWACHGKPCGDAQRNIVKRLLDGGADREKASDYGWRPLNFAGYYKAWTVVEELCARGVDLDTPDPEGLYQVHQAVLTGENGYLRQLLSHGARTDVMARPQWIKAGPLRESPMLGLVDFCQWYINDVVNHKERFIESRDILAQEILVRKEFQELKAVTKPYKERKAKAGNGDGIASIQAEQEAVQALKKTVRPRI
jgi:ankyrin repeat protein